MAGWSGRHAWYENLEHAKDRKRQRAQARQVDRQAQAECCRCHRRVPKKELLCGDVDWSREPDGWVCENC